MSFLQYNQIVLPFIHLESCDISAVDDDFAHVDKIATKFDIRVQTLITADALDIIAPTYFDRTIDPVIIVQAMQEALLQRRRKLSWCFNNTEFIPQPAGSNVKGYVDAMNGPMPQSCQIMRMDETTWLMTYHIVAQYVVNYVARQDSNGTVVSYTNLPGNVVLFNRWEESISIDNTQYSTRTRRGKCMIRSDNDAGLLADEVRSQMAVVSTLPGFLRDRADYTITPDGLGLAYTVVDREVFHMPPAPAYEASGEYEETSIKGDGKRFATCSCTLKGAKFISQSRLAQVAAGVVFNKLNQGGFLSLNGFPIDSASFRFSLYENRVTITARIQKGGLGIRIGGSGEGLVARSLKNIDGPPKGSNKDQLGPMPNYYDRGSASVLLRAAQYWDNSIKATELGGNGGPFASRNDATTTGAAKINNVPGVNIGQAGLFPG